MTERYDEDYFERGVATGKSLYENYHWMPEETIAMAHHLIQHLGISDGQSILDFGCAKGYLVKALRILGHNALGCDVSSYAIEHADPEVKEHVWHINSVEAINHIHELDWVVSKDVLEHLELHDLEWFIKLSRFMFDKAFHVIPLGNGKTFNVPEYELDHTHIIRQPPEWWIAKFMSSGWKLRSFTYEVKGIKEKWTSRYPDGNGFFKLA